MEGNMPVMMISEVSGQLAQGYDGMLAAVGDALRQAPGFILHMAYPVEGGWRIREVWDSQEDATRFYATHIAPNLPDGIRPKLSFRPLHSLVGRAPHENHQPPSSRS
jgi:hypothetical protein